jgi:hypothetical protein
MLMVVLLIYSSMFMSMINSASCSIIGRFGVPMKYLVLMLSVLLLLFAKNSEAYIDPGSGSYVLQLLVASFFAILFALKMFWRNIKAFFFRTGGKNNQNAGSEQS